MIKTRLEIDARNQEIHAKVEEVFKVFVQFLKDSECKHPNLGIYFVEACRRLEEFVHRANDCAGLCSMTVDEAVNEMAQKAIAQNRVLTPAEVAQELVVQGPEFPGTVR